MTWVSLLRVYGITLSVATVLTIGCGPSSILSNRQQRPPPLAWRDKVDLADRLKVDSSTESFQVLLELLLDSNDDVRYAAANAIEGRRAINQAPQLLGTIAKLPRESRWPAFRSLRAYPLAETRLFLINALKEELSFYENKSDFDERNSFYIAESLREILPKLDRSHLKVPALPTDRTRNTFVEFLKKRA